MFGPLGTMTDTITLELDAEKRFRQIASASHAQDIYRRQQAGRYDFYSAQNQAMRSNLYPGLGCQTSRSYEIPDPTAKIGKVTPKPGYIRDYAHPDGVRAKTMQDYTYWQRFLFWINT